jgi:alkylhydroperoxidase family enzyme
MRLTKPRIEPLASEELDAETNAAFRDRPLLRIFRTLARHPKLLKRWMVFGNHVLNKSSLPPRERELVILRVGWLCRAAYEWGQHAIIARNVGVREDEIERIADGPDAEGWSELDRLLLRAADELHADSFVSDDTWRGLAAHYDTPQLMDLVFTVGQYHVVSMALNSFGVQPEDGAPALPQR